MYGSREIEISPPVPVALTTAEAIKAALNISGADSDDELTALAAEVSQQIEDYCGTIFGKRAVTERHHLEEGGTTFILHYSPAAALTSVMIDSQSQTNADFRLNLMHGMLRRVDNAPFGVGEHVIVYDAGYDSNAIPPAVARAALELAKYLYETKGAHDDLVSQQTVDVGQEAYRAVDRRTMEANGVALPNRVALILAPYKRNFVI